MQQNSPCGSTFWLEIPYVAATDRGTIIDTEMIWEVESKVMPCFQKTPFNRSESYTDSVSSSANSSMDTVASFQGPALTELSTACAGIQAVCVGTEHCVLLVEDDAMTRRLMVKGLKKQGFAVVEACNGGFCIVRIVSVS